MSETFESLQAQLDEAERKRDRINQDIAAVCKRMRSSQAVLMHALPVNKDYPCAVAVLPSGKLAVHVWVEHSSEPNQLHIVTPGLFNDDGSARSAFPGEQLGTNKLNRN